MMEWIVTSSAMILIIIALRGLLKGKISLKLQYGLWALVLIRLLLPFSIVDSAISVSNILKASAIQQADSAVSDYRENYEAIRQDAAQRGEAMTDEDIRLQVQQELYDRTYSKIQQNMAQSGTPVQNSEIQTEIQAEAQHQVEVISLTAVIMEALPWFWVAGMMAVAAALLGSNLHFWWKLRQNRKALDIPGVPLKTYLTDYVATPCLFGMIKPDIYLTNEVMMDSQMRHHVIAHELSHYRQGDHFWSVLRCVCLVLHWYNPLVWVAAVLSKKDAELACDEATIKALGETERTAYGRTLIGMTCVRRDPGSLMLTATTMLGTKKTLKERIALIAKKPTTALYTLIACILVVSLAVGCTFTGAPTERTDPAELSDTDNTVWNQLSDAVDAINSAESRHFSFYMLQEQPGDVDLSGYTPGHECWEYGDDFYLENTEPSQLYYDGTFYARRSDDSWLVDRYPDDDAYGHDVYLPSRNSYTVTWTQNDEYLDVVLQSNDDENVRHLYRINTNGKLLWYAEAFQGSITDGDGTQTDTTLYAVCVFHDTAPADVREKVETSAAQILATMVEWDGKPNTEPTTEPTELPHNTWTTVSAVLVNDQGEILENLELTVNAMTWEEDGCGYYTLRFDYPETIHNSGQGVLPYGDYEYPYTCSNGVGVEKGPEGKHAWIYYVGFDPEMGSFIVDFDDGEDVYLIAYWGSNKDISALWDHFRDFITMSPLKINEYSTEPTESLALEEAFQELLSYENGYWYWRAMGCVFDKPENIDMSLLCYIGLKEEQLPSTFTDDEIAFLKTRFIGVSGDDSSWSNAHKLPRAELEAVMQTYFGVSLEDVDTPWVYYSETDAYYHVKYDGYGLHGYTVTDVVTNDDGLIYVYWTVPYGLWDTRHGDELVFLENPQMVMVLEENEDGGFLIRSNLPVLEMLPQNYTVNDVVAINHSVWNYPEPTISGNQNAASVDLPVIMPFSQDAIAVQSEINEFTIDNDTFIVESYATLSDGILSVIIKERTYYDVDHYTIYNFDMTTGDLLAAPDMVSAVLDDVSYVRFLATSHQYSVVETWNIFNDREAHYRENNMLEYYQRTLNEMENDTIRMFDYELCYTGDGLCLHYGKNELAGARNYPTLLHLSGNGVDWNAWTEAEAYNWFFNLEITEDNSDGREAYSALLLRALFNDTDGFVSYLNECSDEKMDQISLLVDYAMEGVNYSLHGLLSELPDSDARTALLQYRNW